MGSGRISPVEPAHFLGSVLLPNLLVSPVHVRCSARCHELFAPDGSRLDSGHLRVNSAKPFEPHFEASLLIMGSFRGNMYSIMPRNEPLSPSAGRDGHWLEGFYYSVRKLVPGPSIPTSAAPSLVRAPCHATHSSLGGFSGFSAHARPLAVWAAELVRVAGACTGNLWSLRVART